MLLDVLNNVKITCIIIPYCCSFADSHADGGRQNLQLMHTDPLYIRKHLIVPKLNLTAICLTITKTSMLDMKTPGDRGTNTSIGNFFQ